MKNLPYRQFIEALEADPRTLVATERPEPHVAVLRMDDPDNMNALSGPLTVQLKRALADAVADEDVRSIVLTGRDPAFSVGGDWNLMKDYGHTYAERPEGATGIWRWIRENFGGVARLITQSDKPVIAAVNGAAAGVALAWALNCDLILASDRAQFVTAFGRIGLVPEVGTNWALTRRVGYQRAFELFVRGGVVTAEEADRFGLVNELVAHDELEARALKWAERVARLPEHAVRMTKPLMRGAADMSWHQAILAEEFAEPSTFTTQYHQQTVNALIAKTEKAVAG